jgi:hypothetical protein
MIHVYIVAIFPHLDLYIYSVSNELQAGRAKPAGLSSMSKTYKNINNSTNQDFWISLA